MCNSRNGAQNSFRFNAVVVVHVCFAQNFVIHDGQDVCAVVRETVSCQKQNKIANQQYSYEVWYIFVFHRQSNDRSCSVTDGKSGNYTQNTYFVKIPHGLSEALEKWQSGKFLTVEISHGE